MDYWKRWLIAAGLRAVRTVSQTAMSMIPIAAMITEVDWKAVAGTALLAGVLSILESLGGLPEVKGISEKKEETK